MRKTVAVIYGGKSAEHDISIITGVQAIAGLDKKRYHVLPIYLSKNNEFFIGKNMEKISAYVDFEHQKGLKRVQFSAGRRLILVQKRRKFVYYAQIDVALVCCHGLSGEDGNLQGLLTLAGIPYTSAGTFGSSLCMDKIASKTIFQSIGIRTADFVWFSRKDYEENEEKVLKKINKKLTYPLMVKPANLGSSIGISKCNTGEDLKQAIEVALAYDSRILVENALQNAREINLSVLGNSLRHEFSVMEEPKKWDEFLSFEDKYLRKNDLRKIDVALPEKIKNKIEKMSAKVFKEFALCGVVRIDFLLDGDDVYMNEINTIPGSLAAYLWKPKGMSFSKLLNRLIDLAEEQFKERELTTFSYQSPALINFETTSGKGGKAGAKH